MANFEKMLNMLILKYFQVFSCIHYINDKNDSDVNIPHPHLTQIDTSRLEDYRDLFKCEGFVILSENVSEYLIAIEEYLSYSDCLKYTDRRYLLVSRNEIDVKEFFGLSNFKFIKDVALVVPRNCCTGANLKADILESFSGCESQNFDWNQCEAFEFWTHRYVSNITNATILLYTWNLDETFLEEDIFPDKMSDQMKKDLVVSVVFYKPYSNPVTQKGAELAMINSFIEYYNFSGVYITDVGFWGSLLDFFPTSESKYKTMYGITDISLGGFPLNEYDDYLFQLSVPTVKTGIRFLVPAPSVQHGLDTPLTPFSKMSWVLLAVFCIIAIGLNSFLVCLYNRYDLKPVRNENSIMLVYAILLQQSRPLHLRVFGSFLLLSGIIFASFYSSGLASKMAEPTYINEIRTLEDLENSNIPIKGFSYTVLENALNDKRYQSIWGRYETIEEDKLQDEMEKTKQLALILEHFDAGYSLGTFEDTVLVEDLENFRTLKEDIIYNLRVMLGYKNSVIFPALNQHILMIKQSGLDYYWMSDAFRDMNYTLRLYFENQFTYRTVKLNWNGVKGTFMLWACGLSIATIQFAVEILKNFNLYKTIKNILKNFKIPSCFSIK